jgi:hypothetical protein
MKDARGPRRRPAVAQEASRRSSMPRCIRPRLTHWNVRSMAKAAPLSHAVVRRIWQAHGLQPLRVETFKLSRDPESVKKLRNVVGVYLHPPAKALVFCVDEEPWMQALDRTEPVWPPCPGIPARQATATSGTARRLCLRR